MKQLFKIKVSVIYLALSLGFVLFWLVSEEITVYCDYLIGKSGSDLDLIANTAWIQISQVFVFFLFVIVYVAITFALCRTRGIFNAIQGVVIIAFALLFLYFILPYFKLLRPVYMAKGYYERVTELGGVTELQAWLKELDLAQTKPFVNELRRIPPENWPAAAKKLAPRMITFGELDSERFINLVYFGAATGWYGLVVVENPLKVPQMHENEFRIYVNSNAFVWRNNNENYEQ
ncbi:MAG: hypothetical protein FVQ82_15890 [Planctomycetes bacterium]|nr:hypothetical protein [Planctomycetota bacterium]